MHYMGELICESPVQYFQVYWTGYIASLLEKGNIDEHLDSPRMLLLEIITEITYNKFNNKENINYFKQQLGEWYAEDESLKAIAATDVQNTFNYFDKSKQKILLELCNKIIAELDEKHYVDNLIDGLTNYIENHTEITPEVKKKIRLYTQLIVAEFVSKGYDLEDIQRYSQDLSEVVIIEGGDIVVAPDKFMDLRREQFASKELYHEAVRQRIDHRSAAEIIQPLKDRYYQPPMDAHLLMSLSYLKGVDEVCIEGVTIYSPKVRRFVDDGDLCTIEKETGYEKLCAAIPIHYHGLRSAIKDAKRKMDRVLELLSLYYDKENGIEYDLGHYCVVKDKQAIADSTHRAERGAKNIDEFYKYASAMDVRDLCQHQESISTIFQNLQQHKDEATVDRLRNAMHWCRKANEAVTDEERLIHSWFALEGLLAIPDDIKDCISPNSSGKVDEIKSVVVALQGVAEYQYLCKSVYDEKLWRINEHGLNYLSNDLKKRSGLAVKPGDKYRYEDFIRCAEELMGQVHDELLKDKLYAVSQFYTSVKNYDRAIQKLKENLQNVYRYRNMIVHNAVVPINSTEYYAKLIDIVSRYVVFTILLKCTKENISIEQALLQFEIEYQHFYRELPERIKHIWAK